jgi:hypothetical protein
MNAKEARLEQIERSTDSSLENDQFTLDPGYNSDRDGEVPEVWILADKIRFLLDQTTHDQQDRYILATAVTRQLPTIVLYELILSAPQSKSQGTIPPSASSVYVLLFPGEARDDTGIKDLNDKVLGWSLHNEYVRARNQKVFDVFHPAFFVSGQDYKSTLFYTETQSRPEFDQRLRQLDRELRQLLLEFLPQSDKRDAAAKLTRKLKADPDYRFDIYYGHDRSTDGAQTEPIYRVFELLTEALKGAATARYVAKGKALKTRIARQFAHNAAADRRLDPRGKEFQARQFLRTATTAPAIKGFVLKPAREQANTLEYNDILVDTVWTQAFFRAQRLGNPDVIRDVRKKKLEKPQLPNVKLTFPAQKDLLELWLVTLNLIDYIKDFREEDFPKRVKSYHDFAGKVFSNIRDLPRPVDTDSARRLLTRDLRMTRIAVLGTASEFQFYAPASDYPERIFFNFDARDLGVDVLLLYDTANGRIIDGRRTGRPLLEETIRSTDVITGMKRLTHEVVSKTFRRYYDLIQRETARARIVATQAFRKAPPRLGGFGEDVQIMLGGDEIFVAAHPYFSKYAHNIVADLAMIITSSSSDSDGKSQIFDMRGSVAFSKATVAGERERHQIAHSQAMRLASDAHETLKTFERQHRRIERLIEMLEGNERKKDQAPKLRQRLDQLQLTRLLARSGYGNPRVFKMKTFERIRDALREGRIASLGQTDIPELIDFNGNVVDHRRLSKDAGTLEAVVTKKVGRDNIHVDPPPTRPAPKKKKDDDEDA